MAGRFVYFSRAELNENLSGDSRRLVQVFRVLEKQFPALELVTVKETGPRPFPVRSTPGILKELLFDGSYRFWAAEYRRHILSLMLRSWIWADAVKRSPRIELAFVEDPVYFPALVETLKKRGTKVIAVCHNIESLSAGQTAPGRQRALLNREIDVLSGCSLAITISREEDFFLNNLGINTFFFPYYPVESTERKMLGIRAEREKREKSGLLLMGSFNNIPTKAGMLKVISFWKERGYALTGERLIVAGFGTDSLKAGKDAGVEVLGTVDEGALAALCSGIKACLCYQEKASGALTKIPEMLMAGVPVIANTKAARSYYNTEGLFEITTLEEIGTALKKAGGFNPPVPKRPAGEALVSSIRKVQGDERQSR
ncbi:hypothetical protein BAC1_02246 [uncultured bacterium]|nr:hypothetical protein BAC1_02246 [uncultured bacterium]